MIDVVGYSPFRQQLSSMPDNRGINGPRLSPDGALHSLPTTPQEIHTSVIRKTVDHSVDSLVPSLKQDFIGGQNYVSHLKDNFVVYPNDAILDDDDFSDHDSHYSEDLEDIDVDFQPKPDMTKQLLNFADMVNTDIQKFFGRKKGEEDSCDIYEDKWTTTKSGRELYYLDLMKIAHGEDKGNKSTSSSPLLDISDSVRETKDNRNSYTGKLDEKLGVGPLNELFEYGLRNFIFNKKIPAKELKRLKTDIKKYESITPMQNRKFPSSFWKQPGKSPLPLSSDSSRQHGGNPLMNANNPPDFSDLLESWRLDRNEFSGEISSSEVSMSPESV